MCAEEGAGPCLFCVNLVASNSQLEVLNRGSRKSEALLKKLLAYDADSEKRTEVIDDESDYFSVDSDKWLNKEQRSKLKAREEELRSQRFGSRLNKKITFDFAGRQILEDENSFKSYNANEDEIVKKIMESGNDRKFGVANPKLNEADLPRPTFIAKTEEPRNRPQMSLNDSKAKMRLQDGELQELSDSGMCLTMHQPFASLLVNGIKRHEGRTWYSPHRGRLWIHAASRTPTEDEIEQVKDFYRAFYGDEGLEFPSAFPTSCLLGSVDVEDCLAQEDYAVKHSGGESSSPFVFICKNPAELLVKYPMSGQHKIYKLDSNVHEAAKKAVKKVSQ